MTEFKTLLAAIAVAGMLYLYVLFGRDGGDGDDFPPTGAAPAGVVRTLADLDREASDPAYWESLNATAQ